MIIKKILAGIPSLPLLLLLLFPIVSAVLYVKKGNGGIRIPLPVAESLTVDQVNAFMPPGLLVKEIHFDFAENCLEVISLPLVFFQEHLTPEQLTEILLNKTLRPIIENTLGEHYKFRNDALIDNKRQAIKNRLGLLTIQNLGGFHDAVVASVPERWYRHIHPLTALLSRSFKPGIINYARLFHISFPGLKSISLSLIGVVKATLKQLEELGVTPARVFQVVQILVGLLIQFPVLAAMIGIRVDLLSMGLSILSAGLDCLAGGAKKNAAMAASSGKVGRTLSLNLPEGFTPIPSSWGLTNYSKVRLGSHRESILFDQPPSSLEDKNQKFLQIEKPRRLTSSFGPTFLKSKSFTLTLPPSAKSAGLKFLPALNPQKVSNKIPIGEPAEIEYEVVRSQALAATDALSRKKPKPTSSRHHRRRNNSPSRHHHRHSRRHHRRHHHRRHHSSSSSTDSSTNSSSDSSTTTSTSSS